MQYREKISFFSSGEGCEEFAEGGFAVFGGVECVEALACFLKFVVDGLFDYGSEAYGVVDVHYVADFFFFVAGVVVGEEVVEACGLFWVAEGECCEGEECFFVVADVLACFFAEDGCVAVAVEEVVLELEGESEVDAEVVEVFYFVVRGVGVEGAYFECCGEEDGCFESYHGEVLVECYVGLVFEVHVVLLAFADADGCFGEAAEYVELAGCRLSEEVAPGEGVHGVAAEDGCVFVPFAVDGGLAAAEG